jgi:TolB-like protein/DNA-binding winged helix-turn-helix (wHTH) protein
MERSSTTKLRIGDWCVHPASGQISRDGETARVDARAMRLLICLAEHAGEVVSLDDLLNYAWADVTVAPDSVYQAVASLRRLLGDDPRQPAYIETVPRLGYRMVAPVSPWADSPTVHAGVAANVEPGTSGISRHENPPTAPTELRNEGRNDGRDDAKKSGAWRKAVYVWAALALLFIALILVFVLYGAFPFRAGTANNPRAASPPAAQPEKSIAVLPFLDLTDEMNQEPFADGMTEELIDKLSKIPGLRVPPPTSSFYFKSKLWPRSHGSPQITISEIAKTLGVAYVLDGSVRRSKARVRVDARLIRADNGYVVWSDTYDRPFDNILIVQADIAGEVAKALRASLDSR